MFFYRKKKSFIKAFASSLLFGFFGQKSAGWVRNRSYALLQYHVNGKELVKLIEKARHWRPNKAKILATHASLHEDKAISRDEHKMLTEITLFELSELECAIAAKNIGAISFYDVLCEMLSSKQLDNLIKLLRAQRIDINSLYNEPVSEVRKNCTSRTSRL
ncbi:hypothetical protein ENBRE01_3136 [Enteropsectra breve]|nr:hypothetical protein ENBRE01_3136 [Enteropsectra breve]